MATHTQIAFRAFVELEKDLQSAFNNIEDEHELDKFYDGVLGDGMLIPDKIKKMYETRLQNHFFEKGNDVDDSDYQLNNNK